MLKRLFPEWPGWWEVLNPKQPWFLVLAVGVANFALGFFIVTGVVK